MGALLPAVAGLSGVGLPRGTDGAAVRGEDPLDLQAASNSVSDSLSAVRGEDPFAEALEEALASHGVGTSDEWYEPARAPAIAPAAPGDEPMPWPEPVGELCDLRAFA